jgi:hypothetical protein
MMTLGEMAARDTALRQTLSEDLRSGVASAFAQRDKLMTAGKAFADKLLRPAPGALPRGLAMALERSSVGPMLKAQQDAGLAAMKRVAPRRRGILLRSTASRAIGQGGRISLGQLSDRLNGLQFAGRIARNLSPRELVRGTARTKPVPPQGETPAVAEPAKPRTRAEMLAAIAERVAAGAPAKRADAQTIAANLEAELAVGPADQAAYYDFPMLRIAWKDVWERALDSKTHDEIVALYREIVQIVPPEAVPKGDVAEVNELRNMLIDLSGVITDAEAVTALSQELTGWIPDLAKVWDRLSLMERANVNQLKFINDVAQEYGIANSSARDEKLTDYFPVETYGKFSQINNATFGEIYDEDLAAKEVLRIIEQAYWRPDGSGSPLGRATQLINQLQRKADAPYGFDVFATDSYNFGVITTFRQKWQPLAYQAGDLAGTIPLAPNEKRSFSVTQKETLRTKRSESTTTANTRSTETGETTRAEADIARRVNSALSADARIDSNVHGGVLGNGAELGFSGGGTADVGNESSQTKKELREVTRKAAQEYRDERKLEVSSESETSWESTTTREITNPNNEIAVTYLFYELQRRYEVSERLHDVIPVVLVAMPMPKPNQINETWLLQHSWIIRDILLDPALAPALEDLGQDFIGDEVAVEAMEAQWKTQMQVVADLRLQMKSHVTLRDQARGAMEDASSQVLEIGEGSKKEVGRQVAEQLFGANEATEAARQALDWADTDLLASETALRDAIGALERATSDYVAAVKLRLNRRSRIDHLILHVKTNILHYMQEIWRREPPGQRYLRIYDLKIAWSDVVEVSAPSATATSGTTTTTISAAAPGSLKSAVPRPGMMTSPLGAELFRNADIQRARIDPVGLDDEVELHEVADLGTIVGFRGNYAAFRLTQPNAVTAFMVQDFLDSHFGLFDPDPLGELPTASEALEMAEKAWSRPGITEAEQAEIAEWLVEALEAAHRISQVIAVPSGELFIEALPGSHAVLEDFKLMHRAADVARAQAEAAQADAELQRRIARIEAGDLDDPDIDRYVRVEGAAVTVTEGG